MDRIKRLSTELLDKYPDRFTTDFEENKKTLLSLAIIRSKVLRNRMAGYITSKLRREADREKAKTSSQIEEEEEEKEEENIEER
jgi:small subunit ribosomal protein S17e